MIESTEGIRAFEDQFCECWPSCAEVWYNPEISHAPFPGEGFNLTRTFKRLVAKRNLSDFTGSRAYFKSVFYYSTKSVCV